MGCIACVREFGRPPFDARTPVVRPLRRTTALSTMRSLNAQRLAFMKSPRLAQSRQTWYDQGQYLSRRRGTLRAPKTSRDRAEKRPSSAVAVRANK